MMLIPNKFVRCIFAATVLTTASSAVQAATNLDVTFTANIRETTCDMKIVGGTGDGKNNTITIGQNGKVRQDYVAAGTATADFKLAIVECPSSLTSLKTTVSGIKSSYIPTAINNSVSSGGASFVAVSIARASAPTVPFTINSTTDGERLVWTPSEITNKEVLLRAKLVETQTGAATTGNFSAVATFNFYYD